MGPTLSKDEEDYILENAYVPEHGLSLMASVSGCAPFLIDNRFLALKGRDWLIVVGYPLTGEFSPAALEEVIDRARGAFKPSRVSIIAPRLTESLRRSSTETERDHYYILDITGVDLKAGLRRIIRKAGTLLTVSVSNEITSEHFGRMKEFIDRVRPPERVKNLLFKMPEFLRHSESAVLLDARDTEGRLAAFNVVDMQPRYFSSYVIGCHSKKNYVPGASDLLCYEMISLSKKRGKKYIHLGLGVNPGIRRFKEKWGGRSALRYEMCELALRRASILEILQRRIC